MGKLVTNTVVKTVSKRVCIVGGTGFVGRVIARQAVEAGHHVTVTTRHPARARDLLIKDIHIKKVDITTGKGLAEAISGSDCVINLVGLLFESGTNTFESAHVTGAEHIISTCKAKGVPQLLHMSALFDEQALQKSNYAKTKHAAELKVQTSGLGWTIFRPSIVFGARDSFLMRFKSLSTLPPLLPVIAAATKFQPIWVEDVARAFVLSIGNLNVQNQTYTLAGHKAYSFKIILELWMQALGRERLLLPVPNLAAALLAKVSLLLPIPLITSDQLALLKHHNITTGNAYPEIFGTTTPFEALLPVIASGGQAQTLQNKLDQARFRKS